MLPGKECHASEEPRIQQKLHIVIADRIEANELLPGLTNDADCFNILTHRSLVMLCGTRCNALADWESIIVEALCPPEEVLNFTMPLMIADEFMCVLGYGAQREFHATV